MIQSIWASDINSLFLPYKQSNSLEFKTHNLNNIRSKLSKENDKSIYELLSNAQIDFPKILDEMTNHCQFSSDEIEKNVNLGKYRIGPLNIMPIKSCDLLLSTSLMYCLGNYNISDKNNSCNIFIKLSQVLASTKDTNYNTKAIKSFYAQAFSLHLNLKLQNISHASKEQISEITKLFVLFKTLKTDDKSLLNWAQINVHVTRSYFTYLSSQELNDNLKRSYLGLSVSYLLKALRVFKNNQTNTSLSMYRPSQILKLLSIISNKRLAIKVNQDKQQIPLADLEHNLIKVKKLNKSFKALSLEIDNALSDFDIHDEDIYQNIVVSNLPQEMNKKTNNFFNDDHTKIINEIIKAIKSITHKFKRQNRDIQEYKTWYNYYEKKWFVNFLNLQLIPHLGNLSLKRLESLKKELQSKQIKEWGVFNYLSFPEHKQYDFNIHNLEPFSINTNSVFIDKAQQKKLVSNIVLKNQLYQLIFNQSRKIKYSNEDTNHLKQLLNEILRKLYKTPINSNFLIEQLSNPLKDKRAGNIILDEQYLQFLIKTIEQYQDTTFLNITSKGPYDKGVGTLFRSLTKTIDLNNLLRKSLETIYPKKDDTNESYLINYVKNFIPKIVLNNELKNIPMAHWVYLNLFYKLEMLDKENLLDGFDKYVLPKLAEKHFDSTTNKKLSELFNIFDFQDMPPLYLKRYIKDNRPITNLNDIYKSYLIEQIEKFNTTISKVLHENFETHYALKTISYSLTYHLHNTYNDTDIKELKSVLKLINEIDIKDASLKKLYHLMEQLNIFNIFEDKSELFPNPTPLIIGKYFVSQSKDDDYQDFFEKYLDKQILKYSKMQGLSLFLKMELNKLGFTDLPVTYVYYKLKQNKGSVDLNKWLKDYNKLPRQDSEMFDDKSLLDIIPDFNIPYSYKPKDDNFLCNPENKWATKFNKFLSRFGLDKLCNLIFTNDPHNRNLIENKYRSFDGKSVVTINNHHNAETYDTKLAPEQTQEDFAFYIKYANPTYPNNLLYTYNSNLLTSFGDTIDGQTPIYNNNKIPPIIKRSNKGFFYYNKPHPGHLAIAIPKDNIEKYKKYYRSITFDLDLTGDLKTLVNQIIQIRKAYAYFPSESQYIHQMISSFYVLSKQHNFGSHNYLFEKFKDEKFNIELVKDYLTTVILKNYIKFKFSYIKRGTDFNNETHTPAATDKNYQKLLNKDIFNQTGNCAESNLIFQHILKKYFKISTRIVSGFANVVRKNTDKKYSVKADEDDRVIIPSQDGHGWSEALIGKYWLTFDATPIEQLEEMKKSGDQPPDVYDSFATRNNEYKLRIDFLKKHTSRCSDELGRTPYRDYPSLFKDSEINLSQYKSITDTLLITDKKIHCTSDLFLPFVLPYDIPMDYLSEENNYITRDISLFPQIFNSNVNNIYTTNDQFNAALLKTLEMLEEKYNSNMFISNQSDNLSTIKFEHKIIYFKDFKSLITNHHLAINKVILDHYSKKLHKAFTTSAKNQLNQIQLFKELTDYPTLLNYYFKKHENTGQFKHVKRNQIIKLINNNKEHTALYLKYFSSILTEKINKAWLIKEDISLLLLFEQHYPAHGKIFYDNLPTNIQKNIDSIAPLFLFSKSINLFKNQEHFTNKINILTEILTFNYHNPSNMHLEHIDSITNKINILTEILTFNYHNPSNMHLEHIDSILIEKYYKHYIKAKLWETPHISKIILSNINQKTIDSSQSTVMKNLGGTNFTSRRYLGLNFSINLKKETKLATHLKKCMHEKQDEFDPDNTKSYNEKLKSNTFFYPGWEQLLSGYSRVTLINPCHSISKDNLSKVIEDISDSRTELEIYGKTSLFIFENAYVPIFNFLNNDYIKKHTPEKQEQNTSWSDTLNFSNTENLYTEKQIPTFKGKSKKKQIDLFSTLSFFTKLSRKHEDKVIRINECKAIGYHLIKFKQYNETHSIKQHVLQIRDNLKKINVAEESLDIERAATMLDPILTIRFIPAMHLTKQNYLLILLTYADKKQYHEIIKQNFEKIYTKTLAIYHNKCSKLNNSALSSHSNRSKRKAIYLKTAQYLHKLNTQKKIPHFQQILELMRTELKIGRIKSNDLSLAPNILKLSTHLQNIYTTKKIGDIKKNGQAINLFINASDLKEDEKLKEIKNFAINVARLYNDYGKESSTSVITKHINGLEIDERIQFSNWLPKMSKELKDKSKESLETQDSIQHFVFYNLSRINLESANPITDKVINYQYMENLKSKPLASNKLLDKYDLETLLMAANNTFNLERDSSLVWDYFKKIVEKNSSWRQNCNITCKQDLRDYFENLLSRRKWTTDDVTINGKVHLSQQSTIVKEANRLLSDLFMPQINKHYYNW